jgi:NAD(P)-dependent dehydrogenase (short-subunit alcohol dehydrogenase family)
MSNILIIGASSGIGKELANKLSANGYNVWGTYNSKEVNENKENLKYLKLDVLKDRLNLEELPEIIDGFVYCPGSINLKPFNRIKPDEFIKDFELQVVGAINVLQSILPRIQKSTNGSIVFFSTVAVKIGLPFHTIVSSSKGAIEGFTRSLAAELAPKIRVNCIAPSLTDTPLAASLLNTEQKREANAQKHPLKRVGTTNDIASMAEFLLSADSSWITGQVFYVDGGMSSIKI